MRPPPVGRRVSLLKVPNFDHNNDQFWIKTKRLVACVVVVKFAVNGNQAL